MTEGEFYVWGDGKKTEHESFNEALCCGDMPDMHDREGGGCGARDWEILKPNTWPPWTRILRCKKCGRDTPVEIPGWKKHG